MPAIITLDGIDEALTNLHYRNPNALKPKLINIIRSYYSDELSIENQRQIDADQLVRSLWANENDPKVIKNKRRNLSSLRSSINTELERLYNEGKNPEGVTIGPGYTFEMSNEAKDKILNRFAYQTDENSPFDMSHIMDVLSVVHDILERPQDLFDLEDDSESKLEKIKELIKNISNKVGLKGEKEMVYVEKGKNDDRSGTGTESTTEDDGGSGDRKGDTGRGPDEGDIKESEKQIEAVEGEREPIEDIEELMAVSVDEEFDEEEYEEIFDEDDDFLLEEDDEFAEMEIEDEEEDEELFEVDEAEENMEDELNEEDELVELSDDDELEEAEEDNLEEVDVLEDDEEIEDAEDESEEVIDDEGDLEEVNAEEELEEEDAVVELAEDEESEEIEEDDLEEIDVVEADEEIEDVEDELAEEVIDDEEDLEEVDASEELEEEDEVVELAEEDIAEDDELVELADGEELEEVEVAEDMAEEDELLDSADDEELEEVDTTEELEEEDEVVELAEEDIAEEDELVELADDEELEEAEEDDLEEVDVLEDDEKIEDAEDEAVEVIDDEGELEEVEVAEDILEEEELLDSADEEDLEEVDVEEDMAEEDELVELVDDEELAEAEEDDLEEVDIIDDDEDESDEELDEARKLAKQFDEYLAEMDRIYNQYVPVPKGVYIIGSKKPKRDELIAKKISIESFNIGKFPVTNALFEVFIEKTGYKTTAEKLGYGTVCDGRYQSVVDEETGLKTVNWSSALTNRVVDGACWYQPLGPGSNLHKKRNHPVVQVSWEDAMAFAAWTGKRLPLEKEWEAAARTKKGNPFPWGKRWRPDSCNIDESYIGGTTPVDHYINHVNGLGLVDTLGNVMEWTMDEADDTTYKKGKSKYYIAKGGSFISGKNVRLFSRFILESTSCSNIVGFRCVAF